MIIKIMLFLFSLYYLTLNLLRLCRLVSLDQAILGFPYLVLSFAPNRSTYLVGIAIQSPRSATYQLALSYTLVQLRLRHNTNGRIQPMSINSPWMYMELTVGFLIFVIPALPQIVKGSPTV